MEPTIPTSCQNFQKSYFICSTAQVPRWSTLVWLRGKHEQASNKKALKGAAPLRYNDIPDVVECISSSSCKISSKICKWIDPSSL